MNQAQRMSLYAGSPPPLSHLIFHSSVSSVEGRTNLFPAVAGLSFMFHVPGLRDGPRKRPLHAEASNSISHSSTWSFGSTEPEHLLSRS